MNGIRILLYHSVGDIDLRDELGIRVDKSKFFKQMRFLKENSYKVWQLGDAIDHIKSKSLIPEKVIVITFDDGYKDNVLNAAPVLDKFSFKATFFVTTEYIGKTKTSPKREWQNWECMDKADLRDLVGMGHEVGSHSMHHLNLCDLSPERLSRELKDSGEELTHLSDREINIFSYPYGNFNDEVVKAVRLQGYKAACTTIDGLNDSSTDPYKLKRTEITSRDTIKFFRKKIEGNA